MFVLLSKTLPLLVYPLGLACLLIVAALGLQKRPGWQRAILILAVSLLWIFSTRWVPFALARSLEWQNIPRGELPSADVIIVLGGGTESQQYPRATVELNSAGDRVLYAAYLYKQGKAAHILVSGGSIDWLNARAASPAQDMLEALGIMGVPASAIWLEDQSLNTYENALFGAKILKAKGITQALLVTSAMHMPRALGLFRAQGIQAIAAPTDFKVTQADWERLWKPDLQTQLINALPEVGNLGLTSAVMKEYLGLVVYRWKGWMQ